MATKSITAAMRDEANAMCPVGEKIGIGLFTQATTYNVKIFGGQFTVGNTGSLDVTTGIDSPTCISVTLIHTTGAMGDGTRIGYAAYPSAGVVRVYLNKCTSGSDPTLVAASATQDISVFCFGT